MRTFDDDRGVQSTLDDRLMAGEAVPDEPGMTALVAALRAAADDEPAPAPSRELEALLREGRSRRPASRPLPHRSCGVSRLRRVGVATAVVMAGEIVLAGAAAAAGLVGVAHLPTAPSVVRAPAQSVVDAVVDAWNGVTGDAPAVAPSPPSQPAAKAGSAHRPPAPHRAGRGCEAGCAGADAPPAPALLGAAGPALGAPPRDLFGRPGRPDALPTGPGPSNRPARDRRATGWWDVPSAPTTWRVGPGRVGPAAGDPGHPAPSRLAPVPSGGELAWPSGSRTAPAPAPGPAQAPPPDTGWMPSSPGAPSSFGPTVSGPALSPTSPQMAPAGAAATLPLGAPPSPSFGIASARTAPMLSGDAYSSATAPSSSLPAGAGATDPAVSLDARSGGTASTSSPGTDSGGSDPASAWGTHSGATAPASAWGTDSGATAPATAWGTDSASTAPPPPPSAEPDGTAPVSSPGADSGGSAAVSLATDAVGAAPSSTVRTAGAVAPSRDRPLGTRSVKDARAGADLMRGAPGLTAGSARPDSGGAVHRAWPTRADRWSAWEPRRDWP